MGTNYILECLCVCSIYYFLPNIFHGIICTELIVCCLKCLEKLFDMLIAHDKLQTNGELGHTL